MGPLCLSCLLLAWPHWLPPALLPLQKPTMSGIMLETQIDTPLKDTQCKDALLVHAKAERDAMLYSK